MTHVFFALFVLGLIPSLVSAHGYLGSVMIDGKSYPGNKPGSDATSGIIRTISTISPVKGASNPSQNCGMNATLATDVATANPGSQLQLHWVGGATGDSNWPHNVGPIMHYMTKCDGSCASYDSSNAEWFKISELGLQSDGSTWYQANIVQHLPISVTIPSDIEPGNWLLRSEVISLQLAVSMGGAEFYPACVQLSIGGSGTGTAKSSEQCKHPGCYSDNDPGIYDPNIYNRPVTYTFPGPSVAAFVGGGGSQGGGTQTSDSAGGSSATPTSGSSSPASSSPVPSSSSGSVSANTSSPSPSTTPPATPSGTSTMLASGKTCYVKHRSDGQLLVKRGHSKKGRLIPRLLIPRFI